MPPPTPPPSGRPTRGVSALPHPLLCFKIAKPESIGNEGRWREFCVLLP